LIGPLRGIPNAAAHVQRRIRLGRRDWRATTLWALDLETGGLDPRSDPILSVGMVPIRDGAIVLGDAFHALARPDRPVGTESLTVHHILPRDLDGAPPVAALLDGVARRLSDIVVVHQRSVDIPFLKRGFREHGRELPPVLVIDTVQLLLAYARRHGHLTPERTHFPTGLADARARFGLPPHRAHEALSDAVATAELFLVLARHLRATRVGQLL
jgi:DNA polymerase-3 subunit epsilon